MAVKINLKFLFGLLAQSDSDEGKMNVLRFCMERGLIASEYECPKCRKSMVLVKNFELHDRYEWMCREYKNPRRHQVRRSVRRGSWFENSKLHMIDILLMTYFFVKKLSQTFIVDEMCVSDSTVCDWRNFFREVCMFSCMKMNEPIGGVGVVVELFECKFSKRKCSRGKLVFSGLERDSNKCFMKVVETKDKDMLLSIIKAFILPGTTVYSDCWKSYDCLEDEEFRLLTSDHSLCFENLDGGGTLSVVKSSMPKHTASNQFESYLGEYLWRRTHSDTDDMFEAFLEALMTVNPPPSRDPPPAEAEDD